MINHVCPTCGVKKTIHIKTLWKKERFKIFNKLRNDLDNRLKLIDVVKETCRSSVYKNKFLKFYNQDQFDLNKEIKNLYLLITDKRQKRDLNELNYL
jgi:hypothetical protein